jgi:translocation and assembly module TamB
VKRLQRSLFALLLLLFGLTALLLWLLTTSTGLWLLITSAVRWVPGLSVDQISRNGSELVLAQLRYHTAEISLQAERLQLKPSVSVLKTGHLGVDDIQLSQFTLQRLQSQRPITITLAQMKTALSWDFQRLKVRPSHLEGLRVTWQPEQNHPLSQHRSEPKQTLEFHITTFLQQLPRAIHCPLAVDLESMTGNDWRFKGSQVQVLNQVVLSAEFQSSRLIIHGLNVHSPEAQFTLQGMIGLHQRYPLSLTLKGEVTAPSLPLAGDQVQVKLTGSLQEQLTLQLQANGPLPLQATVVVTPKSHQLLWETTLHSDELQWPLATPHWQAQAVSGEFRGSLTDYTFAVKARVHGTGFPCRNQLLKEPCDLQLQGNGNQQQLQLAALKLTTPVGTVQATGQIAWSPGWRWQSTLTLQDLTLQQEQLGLLTLGGVIAASGQVAADQWHLELSRLQLQGILNTHPVALSGQLSRQVNGHWHIPQLQASLGINRLDLQGDLGTHCDLQALIKAPRLSGLLPGLAGAIQGKLTLSGTLKQPQLQSDLLLEQFHWQQLSIAQALLKSQISTGNSIHGQTTLRIKQLQTPEFTVDQLHLTAKGNEQQHRVELRLQGSPIAGRLQLQGRFERQTTHWHGILANVQLQTPLGEWRPTRTIQMAYQHPQRYLTVSSHHWHHSQAVLSIPTLTYLAGTTTALVEIQRLDLALLQPLLPSVTQLQGVFTGKSRFHWQQSERFPRFTLALQGRQIKVIPSTQEEPFPVECQQLYLNFQLEPDKVVLDSQLLWENQGVIRTHLQIDAPQTQRQLSGEVELKALTLSSLVGSVKTATSSGMIDGKVRFAGTISHPQLFGGVALTEGYLPRLLPIDNLKSGQLILKFKGQQAQLTGDFQTDRGALRLQGDTQWQHWQDWISQLTIKGDPLVVNWSPGIQLTVRPDLQVTSSPGQIKLQGALVIPKARITLDMLPSSAVKVSKYEVCLDAFQPKKKAVHHWDVLSDFTLSLGEEVQLTGFGLRSHLQGELNVKQTQGGLGLYGQINVLQGRLHAYGQNLSIRKGQLLFSGPVDHLLLDIEAIRDPEKTEDQVIAGLRVQGSCDAPQLTIFSEPALPQMEALAYLLNGRKQADGQYNNNLAAQISLSVLQSSKLVKLKGFNHFIGQMGEAFGISDLTLDTTVVGNNSQIVISGYFQRDLQFKYGVDMLTLRFRIRPRLYLEMVSGVESTLNLLYQFEF